MGEDPAAYSGNDFTAAWPADRLVTTEDGVRLCRRCAPPADVSADRRKSRWYAAFEGLIEVGELPEFGVPYCAILHELRGSMRVMSALRLVEIRRTDPLVAAYSPPPTHATLASLAAIASLASHASHASLTSLALPDSPGPDPPASLDPPDPPTPPAGAKPFRIYSTMGRFDAVDVTEDDGVSRKLLVVGEWSDRYVYVMYNRRNATATLWGKKVAPGAMRNPNYFLNRVAAARDASESAAGPEMGAPIELTRELVAAIRAGIGP